ncbi:MAG: histidinol-phosphate transaminase [Candidatus Sumerlaeia bacterium]
MTAHEHNNTGPRARRALDGLSAYKPGEQPQGGGSFVKLNTNENPYPPPPAVMRALKTIAPERLARYPDPQCLKLRERLAGRLGAGLGPQNILAGNGSDEILRYICNAYLERGQTVAMLEPTYSLYEVLAAMFEGRVRRFAVRADGRLPEGLVRARAKIVFLANPNPPLGEFYAEPQVRRLIEHDPGRLVVLDEAYVDFAPRHFANLVLEYPNLLVVRTFSKSCMMAGVRLGWAVGPAALLDPLFKIKDSYNVNLLTQVAGLAALGAQRYLERLNARVVRDRQWLRGELLRRGFDVPESQANFVFARREGAGQLYEALRARRIFVRWFDRPGLSDGLRISIGTRPALQTLLRAIDAILAERAG